MTDPATMPVTVEQRLWNDELRVHLQKVIWETLESEGVKPTAGMVRVVRADIEEALALNTRATPPAPAGLAPAGLAGAKGQAWARAVLHSDTALTANASQPDRVVDVLREGAFKLGDRVTKTKGSSWTGRIVGTYSTSLTPEGYAVESENEHGSVQIYPRAALKLLSTLDAKDQGND